MDFDTYVDRSGECWLWTGTRSGKGYGMHNVNGGSVYAHRFAWERANGLRSLCATS